MNEFLFSLSFVLAAPFWALIILAPRWSWTQRIIASPWIVFPILLVYIAGVAPVFGEVLAGVSAPTAAGIAELLGTPAGAAIAWAHFIAFDLFVGRWMFLDNAGRLHPLVMAPLLVLTILLAPIGLAVYLLLRRVPAPERGSHPIG